MLLVGLFLVGLPCIAPAADTDDDPTDDDPADKGADSDNKTDTATALEAWLR